MVDMVGMVVGIVVGLVVLGLFIFHCVSRGNARLKKVGQEEAVVLDDTPARSNGTPVGIDLYLRRARGSPDLKNHECLDVSNDDGQADTSAAEPQRTEETAVSELPADEIGSSQRSMPCIRVVNGLGLGRRGSTQSEYLPARLPTPGPEDRRHSSGLELMHRHKFMPEPHDYPGALRWHNSTTDAECTQSEPVVSGYSNLSAPLSARGELAPQFTTEMRERLSGLPFPVSAALHRPESQDSQSSQIQETDSSFLGQQGPGSFVVSSECSDDDSRLEESEPSLPALESLEWLASHLENESRNQGRVDSFASRIMTLKDMGQKIQVPARPAMDTDESPLGQVVPTDIGNTTQQASSIAESKTSMPDSPVLGAKTLAEHIRPVPDSKGDDSHSRERDWPMSLPELPLPDPDMMEEIYRHMSS